METVVVGTPREATPRKQRGKRRPTILELLDRAEAMRAAIAGEAVDRAEVARRSGVTRARVTQLLQLLDLGVDTLAEVRRLAAEGQAPSERSLRTLRSIAPGARVRALRSQARR